MNDLVSTWSYSPFIERLETLKAIYSFQEWWWINQFTKPTSFSTILKLTYEVPKSLSLYLVTPPLGPLEESFIGFQILIGGAWTQYTTTENILQCLIRFTTGQNAISVRPQFWRLVFVLKTQAMVRFRITHSNRHTLNHSIIHSHTKFQDDQCFVLISIMDWSSKKKIKLHNQPEIWLKIIC